LLFRRLEDIMALEERITVKISKRYTICLLVWNNAGKLLLDYAFSKLRLSV